MAAYRIKIEFDESKRAYSGGVPISGNVVVIAVGFGPLSKRVLMKTN